MLTGLKRGPHPPIGSAPPVEGRARSRIADRPLPALGLSGACRAIRGLRIAAYFAWLSATAAATAASVAIDPNPAALVRAMQGHGIVLLGEVHDNAAQHTLRAAALRQWIIAGARPAMAFEQFARERQPDIERARRERPRD